MKNQNIWFFAGIMIVSVLLTTVGYTCPINTTIKVTATNGLDVGSREFVINVADAGDCFEWTLDGGRDIVGDNGNLLGRIEYLKLKIIEDPATSIEFYVTAGSSVTTFTIIADSNNAPTFDPITNPEAYASAGIILTDRNRDGAAITGLYYGGKAYQAVYNGSTVYANLVDTFTAGARKAATQSENYPENGDIGIIDGTLFSINSSFNFNLSANDSAVGTSYFEVFPVPEPATIGLLALGSLVFIGKKK